MMCEWCRAPFVPTALRSDGRKYRRAAGQRYCSTKCNQADYHKRQYAPKRSATAKRCAWCSAEFMPRTPDHRFCSRKCNERGSYRERVGFPEPRPCSWCGKRFNPMTHKRGQQFGYCSKFCRSKAVVLSNQNTTGEYVRRLFAEQDGKCASCARQIDLFAPRGAPGAFHLDHDHGCCPTRGGSCGQCIRALLCPSCNWALGALDEDLDRIYGLAAYVLRSRLSAVSSREGACDFP